jgi:hypothetical protein
VRYLCGSGAVDTLALESRSTAERKCFVPRHPPANLQQSLPNGLSYSEEEVKARLSISY